MPPMKESGERERANSKRAAMQFQPGLREPGFGPGSRKWRCLLYSRSIGAFTFNFQVVFAGWVNAMREARGDQGTLGSIQRSERIVGRPIVELPFMRLLWAQWVGERIGFAKWEGEKIIIKKKKKKGIKNQKARLTLTWDGWSWVDCKEVLRLFSILICSSVCDLGGGRISMNEIFLRKNISLLNFIDTFDWLSFL